MGLKRLLASAIMDWLARNSGESIQANLTEVDMKGHVIQISTLRQIENEWVKDGLIQ